MPIRLLTLVESGDSTGYYAEVVREQKRYSIILLFLFYYYLVSR